MARKTTVLGFSVSPALAREYEELAEREGTTKSDLFRRMVHTYKMRREEQDFLALQRKMAGRIRKTRALTEEKVERIVLKIADEGGLRYKCGVGLRHSRESEEGSSLACPSPQGRSVHLNFYSH